MFKSFRAFMAGFLLCALLMGSIATAMAAGDIPINAILSGTIKMKLFGQDFAPRETNGTYIQPISYGGRTYLPVRALAEALNVPINWDQATSTLWIGGKNEVVPIDNTTLYEDKSRTILTTDPEKLSSSSTVYKWGITNEKPLNSVYFRSIMKSQGKYSHFTASLFLASDVKKDFVVDFRKETLDGVVIRSVTLKPGETVDIDIDISGVQNLFMAAQAGT
ncbi:MAG: stalk domain-containing protein, partial [Syntrophomonas sp.]